MNYLDIFNEAWSSAGFQSRIDSVRGLKGEPLRLHHFINQEYTLLQGHRDWTFKTKSPTIGVLMANPVIPGTGVQFWKRLSYNGLDLDVYNPEDWPDLTLTTGKPYCCMIDPLTNSVTLNPLDANYNIRTVFKASTETLTDNTQIPNWPLDFHKVIAFAGAAALGNFLGDTAIEDRCLAQKDFMIGQMYRLYVRGMKMRSSRPFFV